ncbi:MAG: DUF302 domain-containing protein [Gammaproteobacteria bacterium]|nr:DUF302 domain-containing protein [Gammaproteobacteria bacterium]
MMKTFTTDKSADEVIELLKHGVDNENMRVVSHINGQANAAKMGKTVPADQILEIFRPDYAIRVWEACKPAGHDIPLRIHVYEDEGSTKVACRMPSETFSVYSSDALMEIGKELDEVFENILSVVEK